MLTHSKRSQLIKRNRNDEVAVGEGFEPPELSLNGFQDRRLKPLGHPTAGIPLSCLW